LIIRPALESDAPALSALAIESKAHWGYSPDILKAWQAQLTISREDIRTKTMFVAVLDGETAGFYALISSDDTWELAHLWVSPRFMRKGVGRTLVAHAIEMASRGGAREIRVDADPNAERFYVACGAVRRGKVAAPIPGQPQRIRPQLILHAEARVS
jgi:GNAT superfamily N-acetyltransferase